MGGAAGTFVGLKFRLISGNLRADTSRKAGFIATSLLAVAFAAVGFLLTSLLRLAPPEVAADVGIVLYTFMLFGWAVLPVLAFGLDDTLDPAKLTLFPISTRSLAAGLFASSATGVWPIATLLILIGTLVGLSRSIGGVLVGVLAVLLQFALCLALSRLITTGLSGALRTRRGRDVMVVAGILIVVLAQMPNLLINRGIGDPLTMLSATAGLMRWTPPGMAAHAIADGGLTGLGELAVLALVVLLAVWAWIRLLARALETADASTQATSVRRSKGLADRFLPDGALAAVVAKEFKYIRRDPRAKVNWFASILVTGLVGFSLSGGDKGISGDLLVILLTTMGALMISAQGGNVFGLDGRSFWMNTVVFSTERDLRTDLTGRHLASVVIAAPLVTLLAIVLGAFTGEFGAVLPAVLIAWGTLGVGYGVGSVTSVLLPYTVPERMNAFSGAAPGQGGKAFLGAFGSLIGVGLLTSPLVLSVLFGLTWVSALAVPYGLLVCWGGQMLAGKLGYPRLPELLAAVSRSS